MCVSQMVLNKTGLLLYRVICNLLFFNDNVLSVYAGEILHKVTLRAASGPVLLITHFGGSDSPRKFMYRQHFTYNFWGFRGPIKPIQEPPKDPRVKVPDTDILLSM